MPTQDHQGTGDDATDTVGLHHALLDAWNRRSADDFAAHVAEDDHAVGFDGSTIDGRAAIAAHFGAIFANHPTGAYVGTVREVRRLAPDVAMLRAGVGMTPPGTRVLDPDANAFQTVVAVR